MQGNKISQLNSVSDFDLKLLRMFLQVVDSGGFSAAEPVLGISRSAISQQMADLETRLGLRLCHRGRAGFAMTQEGQEVYQAAHQMLMAVENFRHEVNSLHRHLRGNLILGLTDNLVTSPHMRVTEAIRRLKHLGPDVVIHLKMMPPDAIEQGVLEGRLHLGVVPENQSLSGLEYRQLYQERSLLYCAHHHPLFSAADHALTEAHLRNYESVTPNFRLSPAIQNNYQMLNCTASASDREAMAFLILTGQYLGYLPDHYAQRWVEQGALRAISPQRWWYDLNFVVITRRGRRSNVVLDTFLTLLATT